MPIDVQKAARLVLAADIPKPPTASEVLCSTRSCSTLSPRGLHSHHRGLLDNSVDARIGNR